MTRTAARGGDRGCRGGKPSPLMATPMISCVSFLLVARSCQGTSSVSGLGCLGAAARTIKLTTDTEVSVSRHTCATPPTLTPTLPVCEQLRPFPLKSHSFPTETSTLKLSLASTAVGVTCYLIKYPHSWLVTLLTLNSSTPIHGLSHFSLFTQVPPFMACHTSHS